MSPGKGSVRGPSRSRGSRCPRASRRNRSRSFGPPCERAAGPCSQAPSRRRSGPIPASWKRVQTATGRLQLAIPELFETIEALGRSGGPTITSKSFPLVLSAGERRSFTANTIYRDPKWRRKALQDALTLSPNDAATLELTDGDRARLERLTDAAA